MGNHYIRELMARGERARKQIFSPLLSEFGLTPGQGQARILYYLLLKNHVTQKELADNCHFEVTTMSRNLDKLEKLGLIIRQNNPDCRRSFLICLTDKGIAEAKEIKKVFEQFEQIVSDGITKEEIEVFLKVMTRMCDNMESYNQKEK
ncbi:MAG: MarR family transcriptional regulator [Clostridiales bacterium]|jgi:MarR family transcriptional regulator for hemolysin|uniref:MarR family winged helix-turn-helix transcriptional regulator n=1 Tax=Clostridium sp. 12(A) TaxID=1163671 RepID=UPI00046567B7|nr:MarR family transcriptional regulator [Clostridium sp. 12(A)]MBS5958062.1 MarR family transcriptional regulator [Clostridiales bacterium]